MIYEISRRYKQTFLAITTGMIAYAVLVVVLHVPYYVETALLHTGSAADLPPRDWFYVIGCCILIPVAGFGCRIPIEIERAGRVLEDKDLRHHAKAALASISISLPCFVLIITYIVLAYGNDDYPRVVISSSIDIIVVTLLSFGLAFGFIVAAYSLVQLKSFFTDDLPQELQTRGRKGLIQLLLTDIIGVAGAVILPISLLSPPGFYTFRFFSLYGTLLSWVLVVVFTLRTTWYFWKAFESVYRLEQGLEITEESRR
ncbi:MAG: hypothetical protein JW839_13650 [Candidatus Lokiarchaeota archaeon]|nr:hypothetical protein [Candidatus Lokiarchaeota archaeon]